MEQQVKDYLPNYLNKRANHVELVIILIVAACTLYALS
jgi:hypothetical protein